MVSFTKFAVAATWASANGLSIVPSLQTYANNLASFFSLQDSPIAVDPAPATDSGFAIELKLPGGIPGNDRPIPGDSPLVQCDVTEAQLLNLQSVILEPNPPLRGENLTIIAKGYLDIDIEDGAYVEVDVRYGFIKLLHQTFDICEEISAVDLECPIAAGQHIIIKEVEIPSEVPPGKYIVTARAYTQGR
ncbi:hypothetical protein CANTEDRAFT_115597 [Yamadazyma tenuis ATCC 10573]|uniref:Phosphatidylglycerol/phosphatidylinositol transfer protein n=1 Tax=Candida tenuis (strain ATCC 10573 / BCRC 21748 / CBS 615 / JCM 9827 / NBRC 10315 / NRRL Y-1498 / VKM Y-70) TaxID=590646 RepID=G3BB37_CANTC|nr:uncharacterized protein CANTEDRAFT_115597 [Yamadazyma tenuis ATCC 10573]XP_006688963.1 uncharacterized protein CANTEDRAFT_115597 [Yamadazyma tenuis ATCC 10573]EGV62792.1 hypothetical protein CANTEDRAFT_115597 [Yamadazyma tenuis ATCC 10573]EGV62793.1 hypothetical protein CANTEDRAFT_115597 [Yamadazyma tenuis ATCC 10573]